MKFAIRLIFWITTISLIAGESLSQSLVIHHINVGQGDATLIQVANGKNVLIDAGGTGKGKKVVLPYLQTLGITSIDYLVASHYHADHIGGLDEVIEGLSPDSVRVVYDRGMVIAPPTTRASSQYWSSVEKVSIHTAIGLGQTVALSNNTTLRCVATGGRVLNSGEIPKAAEDENNLSLAWALEFEKTVSGKTYTFRYFTGGDCGGTTGNYADLETPLSTVVGDVDGLKINHHGSRYSTNQTFLDSLRPEAAVISVGDQNTYRHPAQETLDRLEASRSARFIYQTEKGNGGASLKVKILGTVQIAVFDSFYTIGTDTFRLASRSALPNGSGITTVGQVSKSSQRNIDVSIDNGVLVFRLVDWSFVSVRMFNLLGQEVHNLAEGCFSPGSHTISLRSLNLVTGVYFVRLSTPYEVVVRKTLILR